MKKSLLALIAGLSFAVAGAQEITCQIKKSDVFKDEYKRSDIISFTDDGQGGTIVVRNYSGGAWSSAHGYYIEHYDADLKLIKDFDYELKRGRALGVVVYQGMVNFIDFNYDKSQKAYLCQVSSANIDDFKFSTHELFRYQVDEIKNGFFGGGQSDSDSFASLIMNEDRTYFGISIDLVDKKHETHDLYIFDASGKQTLKHTFKRDIKDRKFILENIDVSKDGKTVMLLGKASTEEMRKKKEGGKYQYELTRISGDGEQTRVFDTEDHFVGSLKGLYIKDKVACIGFYSDQKDWRYKGLCYFELDPVSLDIKKSKYNPFTEQFMMDKYGKDKDKELNNLSFRGIFVTAGGEIVFNAEEFFVTQYYVSTGNGGGYWRTVYNYNDIVSAKISASGDLLWARNINKKQASSGDNPYISYTSTVKGDDTYFFINTGEKVKKLRADRIQFGQTSAKRSNLNIIKINSNGDFDYREILDDKDNDVPFMVMDGVTDGNSTFFLGRKGSKKQLLKITL